MMGSQANTVGQQSYTFVAALPTERKKRFSSKTKSGCDTCKKRHVKCDEGRPTCANCNRGERRCEGYQTGTVGNYRQRHGKQYQKQNDHLPQQMSLNFGNVGESQWLDRWFDNTAKEVARFSNPYFWYTLIPQASWSNESVRQALIAVSIACDEYSSPYKEGLNVSRVLYHYNKSIRALTQSHENRPASSEIVLLCCVLFWLLENIKNRPFIAMTHLKAAVNMLNEHTRKPSYRDDILASCIEPVIQEGMLLACTAIPTGGRYHQEAMPTIEAYRYTIARLAPNPKPKDIHESQMSFANCQEAMMTAKRMAMSPNSPNPDLAILRDLYSSWEVAMDSHSKYWPRDPVRLLRMHHHMHMMAIDVVETELEGGNIRAEPSWRPRLQYLLNETKYFANLATEKGYTVINLPIISPLSFIARQCMAEHNDIAEEALATLEQFEFFEGIWNSRVAAQVVRLMRSVDLEHECCAHGDLEAVLERAAFAKAVEKHVRGPHRPTRTLSPPTCLAR